MSEEYIRRNPGDLITAEDWNAMQGEVKKDIANQVGEVQKDLDEFKEAPVDADTFDGKNSSEWIDELDKHYAPLDHDHNGVRRYQRYFLELEQYVNIEGTPAVLLKQLSLPLAIVRLQPAIIQHNMGRHPVVQVYELMDLPIKDDQSKDNQFDGSYKFCFAGPSTIRETKDPESVNFKTKSWDEIHWGSPLEANKKGEVQWIGLMEEIRSNLNEEDRQKLEKALVPENTLETWLRAITEALFEPGPAQYHFDENDDVYYTTWINENSDKSVSELTGSGQWPPRFLYRPRLVDAIDLGGIDSLLPLLALFLSGKELGEISQDIVKLIEATTIGVYEIFHLNLNEVEIAPYIFQPYLSNQTADKVSPLQPFQPVKAAQFMVLLRS